MDTNQPSATYVCGVTNKKLWTVENKEVEKVAMCVKKKETVTGQTRKVYEPPAQEAENATEVGGIMLFLLLILLIAIILFDFSTVTRDVAIIKANVVNVYKTLKGPENEKEKEKEEEAGVNPNNPHLFTNQDSVPVLPPPGVL